MGFLFCDIPIFQRHELFNDSSVASIPATLGLQFLSRFKHIQFLRDSENLCRCLQHDTPANPAILRISV
jgi:hypothetical protein